MDARRLLYCSDRRNAVLCGPLPFPTSRIPPMANGNPGSGLQLRSLIKSSGELELSLATVDIADPAPGEVLVRVEGSPINPSDLGLLLGAADMSTAEATGGTMTASVPQQFM